MSAIRYLIVPPKECNFMCCFCHKETFPDYLWYQNTGIIINPKELRKVTSKITKIGFDKVIFTGGEPLLLMSELLNFLHILIPFHTRVITNGALLTLNFIKEFKLAGLGRLIISIPSLNSSKYFKITGQSKVPPDQIIDNIALSCRNGLCVQINYVVIKGVNDTADEALSILELAVNNGVRHVAFLEKWPPSRRSGLIHWKIENDLARFLHNVKPCRGGRRYIYKDSSVDVIFSTCGGISQMQMY